MRTFFQAAQHALVSAVIAFGLIIWTLFLVSVFTSCAPLPPRVAAQYAEEANLRACYRDPLAGDFWFIREQCRQESRERCKVLGLEPGCGAGIDEGQR